MGISKGKINQAGLRFIEKESKVSQDEASSILQQFRLIHQHPMDLFRNTIDRKLKKHNIKKALVSQRLKRIQSIIQKLKIQDKMQLSRMQDIGGLRVVVDTLKEVETVREEFKKTGKHGSFKFTLTREANYIKHPRDSGYRSLHLVYKYNKNIEIEKQCNIEIQIRTKLQHSWATAVEVLGTYLDEPLKQSIGNEKYLNIFKDISKLFVSLEEKNMDYSFVKKVQKDIKNVELLNMLKNFNIVLKHLNDSSNIQGQYILLKMDFKQKFVEIKQYSKAKFEQANAGYSKMEIDNLGNDAIEVVLLSIQNIKKLKQSYPNYFMDTEEFIKNLDKLFELSDKKKEIEERIDNTSNKKGKIALRSMLNSILKKIYKGNK